MARWRDRTVRAKADADENRLLDEAVGAWRARRPAAERLSPGARDRLWARVREGVAPADRLHPLFAPVRRWVLAGAVPALVVLALLLPLAWRSGTVPERHEGPTILASRIGDSVVFTIANGNRTHRVYRSATPDRFDLESPIVVGDRYVEPSQGDLDLVFYKVD